MCQRRTQSQHYYFEKLPSTIFEGCLQFVHKITCFRFPLFLIFPILFSCHSSFNLLLAISLSIFDNLRRHPFNCFINPPLLQLAFPNNNHIPSFSLQFPPNLLIPLLISCHLGHPEIRICLRDRVILAAIMSMPAAVDENDSMVLWKDDVRTTGEASCVYAISKALAPKSVAQEHLWASILGSVMRHTNKSLFRSHRFNCRSANLHRLP